MFKLHVWGEFACFTRPEMKVERVSYDVMTPSAARGILEAVHWKPAIKWTIERIHVLRPIRFQTFRRNEVGSKIPATTARSAMNNDDLSKLGLDINADRQQRATIALVDVAYVIEARFDMTPRAGEGDSHGKHAEMFSRRARKGQCFPRPALGCREFAAHFELVEDDMPRPSLSDERKAQMETQKDRDLGWMLYDLDYSDPKNITPHFFRARLENGVLDLEKARREGLVK